MAVDASNMTNGGLEVVEGSHSMDVPINREDNCIEKSWVDAQKWTPVELEAGAFLVSQNPNLCLLNFHCRRHSHIRFLPRPPKWS